MKLDPNLLKGLVENNPNATIVDLSSAISTTIVVNGAHENDCIDSESLTDLLSALKTNTTLTTLDLDANDIGTDKAIELASILQNNKSLRLKILNLSWNAIDKNGLLKVASFLKSNNSLNELWMDGNEIDEEVVKELASALEMNETLRLLSLKETELNDDHAARLASALKINQSLTTLDLTNTHITREGIKSMAPALQENSFLRTLKLTRINSDIDEDEEKSRSDLNTVRNILVETLTKNYFLLELDVNSDLTDQRINDCLLRNRKIHAGFQLFHEALVATRLTKALTQTILNRLNTLVPNLPNEGSPMTNHEKRLALFRAFFNKTLLLFSKEQTTSLTTDKEIDEEFNLASLFDKFSIENNWLESNPKGKNVPSITPVNNLQINDSLELPSVNNSVSELHTNKRKIDDRRSPFSISTSTSSSSTSSSSSTPFKLAKNASTVLVQSNVSLFFTTNTETPAPPTPTSSSSSTGDSLNFRMPS